MSNEKNSAPVSAIKFNTTTTAITEMSFVPSKEHDYSMSFEEAKDAIIKKVASIVKAQKQLNALTRVLIVKTFEKFSGKELEKELDKLPELFEHTPFDKPVRAYIKHINYVCPRQDILEQTDILMFGREVKTRMQVFGNGAIREMLDKRLKKASKLLSVEGHPDSIDSEVATLKLLLLRMDDIEAGKVALTE